MCQRVTSDKMLTHYFFHSTEEEGKRQLSLYMLAKLLNSICKYFCKARWKDKVFYYSY